MKYYLKKLLCITFFLATFDVCSMPDLFHKATKALQKHPLIHGYKQLSRPRQFSRAILAGMALSFFLKKEFFVSDTEWKHRKKVLPLLYILYAWLTVDQISIIKNTRNANKVITKIMETLLSEKNGLTGLFKKFKLITNNYYKELKDTLENIIDTKNILCLKNNFISHLRSNYLISLIKTTRPKILFLTAF